MAFPTTLTGIQDNVGYATRPFISSAGNVYVFGRLASATDRLRAVKATDPTTSFSAVGTDVEMVDTVAMAACIDAVQVGDVIHIVTGTGGTSAFYIHYHTFNMATDAWTISAEVVKSNFPLVDFNSENRGVGIAVRSDGDVIVLYNGTYDTIVSTNYARVKYARRESGTWTIDVAVDNAGTKNWVSGGAVLGSSDRTHLFFDDFTADDGYQRALTSANVLETFPATYDTAVNTSGREQGKAVTYVSGGVTKVRYAYSDGASDSVSVVKFDSADAPTITEDVDVTGTSGVENNYYVSGLAVDGTTLWHAYVAGLSDDIFTQSNADDAGWSGVTNRIAGTFNSVRANIYTRGTDIVLAFVYAAAGADALYNELDIGDAGAATISGSAALTLAALTAVSAGTVATSGSAAFTLGAITTSAAGTVATSGSAAFTLGALTVESAGTVGATTISGSAAFTLGALTAVSAGTVATSGSAAFTLGALTAVSAGTVATSGSAAFTLAALTAAATGAVATSGSAAFTLAALTAAATGAVATSGSAAFTLGALTVESAGTSGDPAISGSAAFTLGALTAAATGAVATSGDAAFTLGTLTTESAGTNANPATATDSSAGSGGKSARRKFKLPEEAIEEAWSLERLYREDPVEAPVQEDITDTIVYTPLTLAVVVAVPHSMVMRPMAPVPKAHVLTRAVDEDDEEFDNVVRLIAVLF